MNGGPSRAEVWVAAAAVLLTVIGAIWSLSGRIARVEQRLDDQMSVMQDQSNRMQTLEHEIEAMAARH